MSKNNVEVKDNLDIVKPISFLGYDYTDDNIGLTPSYPYMNFITELKKNNIDLEDKKMILRNSTRVISDNFLISQLNNLINYLLYTFLGDNFPKDIMYTDLMSSFKFNVYEVFDCFIAPHYISKDADKNETRSIYEGLICSQSRMFSGIVQIYEQFCDHIFKYCANYMNQDTFSINNSLYPLYIYLFKKYYGENISDKDVRIVSYADQYQISMDIMRSIYTIYMPYINNALNNILINTIQIITILSCGIDNKENLNFLADKYNNFLQEKYNFNIEEE